MAKETLLEQLIAHQSSSSQQLPGKEQAHRFIEELFAFLFDTRASTRDTLVKKYAALETNLTTLLSVDGKNAVAEAETFFKNLSTIYDLLLEDAHAILNSDPAARSLEEVIAAYPGFFAIFVYRTAHQLCGQGHNLLSRFFTEYAHSKTGIDIHPAARIGRSFAIDHGTGIVIGETSQIGNHVKIYQGVTLGALNVSKSIASTKRHPTIEDGVVIYSGATILGGSTVVGAGSIIGGNVWLTYSIPPNSVVYHKSEVHVKDNNPFPEPWNYVI